MIRIGVIGCGYWGPNLIRNFYALDGVEIGYICDLDKRKLGHMHKQYPSVQTTTKAQRIFDDKSIDAVVIATPVSSHFSIAEKSLLSGKHTLIEKPMTKTTIQAQKLITLAKKKKKVLMVDHIFVYSSPVQKMKEIVTAGKLGSLCYFDSVRVNLGLFQPDTNVLWDLATHDLSIMDFLIDKKPKAISAVGSAHVKKNVENIVYVTIRFPGDLIGHIHVNWLAPVKLRMTLLAGLDQMIAYNDMEPMEKIKVYDRGIDYHPEADDFNLRRFQYRVGDMHSPRLDDVEALHFMCKHFIECISENKTPLTDGEAGLRIIRYLEAANTSIKNKGEFVSLT